MSIAGFTLPIQSVADIGHGEWFAFVLLRGLGIGNIVNDMVITMYSARWVLDQLG